jgi:mannosyl-3-phosphoglycerate phosphatase
MTALDLSHDTGLPIDQAALALHRDYDLPFKILDISEKQAILKTISEKNLSVMIGGRYYHLMGNHTKGNAVKILHKLYKRQYTVCKTMALGDSYNDVSMLNTVDIPYLVKQPDGRYISEDYNHAKGVGPNGWCKAVVDEISNYL